MHGTDMIRRDGKAWRRGYAAVMQGRRDREHRNRIERVRAWWREMTGGRD